MARVFDIPSFYRSSIITKIKVKRYALDQKKRDLSPTILDLGRIRFKLARHFGFCFGVQNAIETAFRALREHPGRRIYLLSEMIHNPAVNSDLEERGLRFIFAPDGSQKLSFDELSSEDIVIVPAFGTTVELIEALAKRNIDLMGYDATCPFVEKVWRRSMELGQRGFTIVIHGKHLHEETKATFSHASRAGPSIIIGDMREARMLGEYIRGSLGKDTFVRDFSGRYSKSFDPARDLSRIGVVNQTTMLAAETQEISNFLENLMRDLYGSDELLERFADMRDTLCYATAENQNAVKALIESGGTLALVIGGYNSSNTTHLAKLCEQHCRTYHIKDSAEIVDLQRIRHRRPDCGDLIETEGWLPQVEGSIDLLLSAGASSPDSLVDACLTKIVGLMGLEDELSRAMEQFD